MQGIRAFTILQLLLGNIGKPGGGVNALRGEPNVQGACDMGCSTTTTGLSQLPGNAEPTSADYGQERDSRRKYLVNTLKAFFGPAATPENDFGYGWLPKRNADKDFSTLAIFENALAGKMKLLWIVGQNPAVTIPNLKLIFDGMEKLETLVVHRSISLCCRRRDAEAVHRAVERPQIRAPVGHRQTAEMIPGRDLVSAGPQLLAGLTVECVESRVSRVRYAALGIRIEAAADPWTIRFVPRQVG